MANYKGRLTGQQIDELPSKIAELREQTKDISQSIDTLAEVIQVFVEKSTDNITEIKTALNDIVETMLKDEGGETLKSRIKAIEEELNVISEIVPTNDDDNNGIPDGEDRLRKIEEDTKVVVNEDGIVL